MSFSSNSSILSKLCNGSKFGVNCLKKLKGEKKSGELW